MKIRSNKKSVVLIYILFLVTVSIVFSTVLINNNAFLFNISRFFDVDSKLYGNINSDASIMVNINREANTNGSGFVDNIRCPTMGVSMSGVSLIDNNIGTNLINSGTIYCEGNAPRGDLQLFFNSGFTDISRAVYGSSSTLISYGLGDYNFMDPDSTHIDITGSDYLTSDDLDDNFNSDNYRVNSTGSLLIALDNKLYPNGFQDDDVVGRLTLFGYVAPSFGFKKVFWNTSKVLKVIDENYNNEDDLNMKIGAVTQGRLHFDVDKAFDLRVVNFDRAIYNDTKELVVKSRVDGSLREGIGYLHNTAGVLSLEDTPGADVMEFDFQNEDYAVFIKDTGSGTLLYKIKAESQTGTGIYITPINDEDENIVDYVGNEILLDDKGGYLSKEVELIFKK